MEKISQNNSEINPEENIAQLQETKKSHKEYLAYLNRRIKNPSPYESKLSSEEINELEKQAEITKGKIAFISKKFEDFIKKHGGLKKAKDALIESRKDLITEKEKDNPIWMTTFPITEIIPDIKLEGLKQKERPNPAKAVFRLHDERFEYDNAPESVKNTTSRDLDTPYADFHYHPEVLIDKEGAMRKIDEDGDLEDESKKRFKEDLENQSVIMEKIRELFKGRIVIDIAAGGNPFGYLISDIAEAKAYVGIEPFRTSDLFNSIHDLITTGRLRNNYRENHDLNGTPLAIVREDMLSFLKRLPDNSVSVWCSGIDNIVIPDKEYRELVAKEIERVLDPDGAYIGGLGHIYMNKTNLVGEETKGTSEYSRVTIYRKKFLSSEASNS